MVLSKKFFPETFREPCFAPFPIAGDRGAKRGALGKFFKEGRKSVDACPIGAEITPAENKIGSHVPGDLKERFGKRSGLGTVMEVRKEKDPFP